MDAPYGLRDSAFKERKAGKLPHVRVWAGAGSSDRVLTTDMLREVALPVLAVAAIVAYADVRTPLGLPGHRGLVWLAMLVAVALVRRETVIAVGAAATATTLALHLAAGPWGAARYLAAAVLLYAVAAWARRRPWLLALAAAPIHLVALAGSFISAERAAFHLVFGLTAGLLGWAVAFGMGRRREWVS
nr:hypothetical protein [Mycobacterium sp. MFM001]